MLLLVVTWLLGSMSATSMSSPSAPPILSGPYATAESTLHIPGLSLGEDTADVYWASNASTNSTREPLRFICFAHGAMGGLVIQPIVYRSLLHSLASWGYVVVAARACLLGVCLLDDYAEQQVRVIDWARSQAAAGHEILSLANFTHGLGIAGHSMGGRATLQISEASIAQKHGVVAAVMIHAYTSSRGPPSVPFLALTGTTDDVAPMSMTERFFEAASDTMPRGLVEKVNATHQEPSDYNDRKEPYNPRLQQFVAGWFKLHLDRTPVSHGVDWDSLIYGDGATALCGGGDGAMARCETHRG